MRGWEPANTELYHAYFQEFLNTVDRSAIISHGAELIAPYVARDSTRFCTYAEFEKGVETLTAFCDLRVQSVALQLAGDEAAVDASAINLSDMETMGGGFGDKGQQPGMSGDVTGQFGGFGNHQFPNFGDRGGMIAPDGMQMPEGMDNMFPGWDGNSQSDSLNGGQMESRPIIPGTPLLVTVVILAAGLLFAFRFRRR